MTEVALAETAPPEQEGAFVTYPGSPFQLFCPYQPAGDLGKSALPLRTGTLRCPERVGTKGKRGAPPR